MHSGNSNVYFHRVDIHLSIQKITVTIYTKGLNIPLKIYIYVTYQKKRLDSITYQAFNNMALDN